MSADIVPLRTAAALTPPVAQFVRLGEAHRKLEDLLAEDRFPATRVVVEAARLLPQKRLIEALRKRGVEIVLDPQVAELAAPGKYLSNVRRAPWGRYCQTSPLGPQHFRSVANSDVIGEIARFAVTHGVDVVLAPTHFLADPRFDWFTLDREACTALRRTLDREGGTAIAIDYPLLHSHVELENADRRRHLLAGLTNLPFDYLWVRASGLAPDAGPLTVRRFLSAMSDLCDLRQPIILDYLGGLLGSAAIAFGVASGKAHGIGERERFDARDWHKPPRNKDPEQKFGRTQRIAVPGLGRSVSTSELEVLASARGGRKLVVCGDRDCCSHGLSDMLADPRRHMAHQTFQEIDALSSVPESYRGQHFLNQTLDPTVRRARDIKRLKPTTEAATQHQVNVESLMRRLCTHADRLEKVQRALGCLHGSQEDGSPRARSATSLRTRQHNTRKNER